MHWKGSESMAHTWEVGMLLAVWGDYDRALEGVSREDMVQRLGGGSAFAWTVAHVTYGIDSWINGRFQGFELHPLLADPRFGLGGDGQADDWEAIRDAVADVRSRAASFLVDLGDADLERVVQYDGSFAPFQANGIQLRAAVVQSAVHHHYHLGEIVAKKELLGYEPGTFPGVGWWVEFLKRT